jgi:hypothetical protein
MQEQHSREPADSEITPDMSLSVPREKIVVNFLNFNTVNQPQQKTESQQHPVILTFRFRYFYQKESKARSLIEN